MTKGHPVLILLLLSTFVSGCFVDSRITGLAGLQKDSSSASDINIEIKTQPNSIAYLDSGAVDLTIVGSPSEEISDFQVVASESCQVITNGCGATVTANSNCSVQLRFDGNKLNSVQCNVQFSYRSKGQTVTKDVAVQSPVSVPGITSVQKVYPLHGANWNDYILNNNSSKDIWHQGDSACTLVGIPSTPPRNYCLHGAEHLKVATGLDSCSGLTLVETLGVFKWKCVIDDGKAYFFSSDIKDGKGLRNLISTTGWIDNSVKVYKNASLILESPLAKWWNNVVQALPANPSTPGLSLPASADGTGIIYYFSSDLTTRAYRPAAKTALVSLNSAKLKPLDATATETTCVNFFGNRSCLLDLTNAAMTWIEADLEYTATSAPYWAIYLKTAYFARVVNTSIAGRASTLPNAGIYADDADFIKIKDTNISSFSQCLHWYSFNDYTTIENVFLKGCTFGIDLNSFNYATILRKIYVLNNARGVVINASSVSTVIQGVSSFNNANGNSISGSSTSPVYVMSMLSVNSGNNSSNTDLFIGSAVTVTNLAITNSLHAISLAAGNSAKFTGALVLGSNVNNCTVVGSNNGLVNSTCANSFTDGASVYGTSSSDAVLRIGKTAVNSFNGRVTVNDIKNAADTNGLVAFASLVSSALLNLDSVFRSWGAESTNTFDNTSAQGRCSSGNCRIYDWTMKLTDTVFKNTSGDGATQNQAFVAGNTCPSAIHGNKVTVSNGATPLTYLNNAWEFLNDGVGDDDGLCESSEDCSYAPNFGAYQNELDGGVLSSEACLFQNGILSNIKVYGYQ